MPNFLYSAKNYTNRKEWLKGRRNSIGASEIAVVMGISHFKTPDELWREKRGESVPPDLSDNDRVQYGTEAEEYLRKLFALKHRREYGMSYHPFKVFYRTDTPYLTCTLDGELQRYSDGARGIYECKTALIESKEPKRNGKAITFRSTTTRSCFSNIIVQGGSMRSSMRSCDTPIIRHKSKNTT